MPEKILIIAEKPSVASDLVKILPGRFVKEKTHYESDTHVVSFAIGHLVSICFPEEIDPAYQKWDMAHLPILPESFPLKGLDGTKSQLNVLQRLIRRKDIKLIINACDAGREGELIFKYIIKYVWNTSVAEKTFKRLWLQSMTADSIRSALSALRDNSEMLPLEDAALCRSESDWLIGINATRALTSYNSRKGGFFLTPCGRVQTPTLSLMVKRERSRLDFVAKPFWNLQATFACGLSQYQGKWVDPQFARESGATTERADRLWDKEQAEAILAKCRGHAAEVEEHSKKSTQGAPPLFDLTLLQREANSRFGLSAKNTLSLAQALYEKHKVLTYPRTDSKHLPEDYLDTTKEIMQRLAGGDFGTFAGEALAKNYIRPDKRIFNNTKISDHHAIIPTILLPTRLNEFEAKIYAMVVQRFIAVFFPPAVFLNTRRTSLVQEETFLTEGKILLDAGWKKVYGTATGDDAERNLDPLPTEAEVHCVEIDLSENETTPPPRYNEATLLSAMENSDKLVEDEELAEAMKERGLGTPATRAAIIEKLIKEKYLVREGKELAPTGKAFELLALLEAMNIDVLASPEMTGEWEFKLNRMLKGQFTRDQFMAEIRSITRQIIDRIKNFENAAPGCEASFSPLHGVRYFSTPTAYVAEDKKTSVRKILGGRPLNDQEVAALLCGETIGPFTDFRSKMGKPFTASVRLVEKKIEFLFATTVDEQGIEAAKGGKALGLSPIDHTKVYATPLAYMSESALDGDRKKGLKISKTILSRELNEAHVQQLLEKGRTELINGFISKKKRPFDAYLLLSKNGTLSFEFPPRKEKSPKQKPLTAGPEKGTNSHETD
jgi:DNA topoisomerase-3